MIKDDSDFGTQTTIEEQGFLKQRYVIPDNATKWPKVKGDIFVLLE